MTCTRTVYTRYFDRQQPAKCRIKWEAYTKTVNSLCCELRWFCGFECIKIKCTLIQIMYRWLHLRRSRERERACASPRSIYNCARNNCTNDPANDNFGFYYGNFNISMQYFGRCFWPALHRFFLSFFLIRYSGIFFSFFPLYRSLSLCVFSLLAQRHFGAIQNQTTQKQMRNIQKIMEVLSV